MKNEFEKVISPLSQEKRFTTRQTNIELEKDVKLHELRHLEKKMKIMKDELDLMDSKLKTIQDDAKNALIASRFFKISIEKYPARDFFEIQKTDLMKTRMTQTVRTLLQKKGYSALFIESCILKDRHDLVIMLENLVEQFSDSEPVYNAAVDGWEAEEFHHHCDGKTSTLVLIQVGEYIFGGFNPRTWNEVVTVGERPTKYLVPLHPEAFLFSLSNPKNLHVGVKFLNTGEGPTSVSCDPSYGPTFGGGFDLYISGNPSKPSYSKLGRSYRYPGMTAARDQLFFCGSITFTPTNLEVYQMKSKF